MIPSALDNTASGTDVVLSRNSHGSTNPSPDTYNNKHTLIASTSYCNPSLVSNTLVTYQAPITINKHTEL